MNLQITNKPRFEDAVWHRVHGEWRQIYGSFPNDGVSIEWHDFDTPAELNWAESFHTDSLEICLNLSGSGSISRRAQAVTVGDFTLAVYRADAAGIRAARSAAGRHRFITVELSRAFLQQHLAPCPHGELHPVAGAFIEGGNRGLPGAAQPMTVAQQTLAQLFREPPVPKSARPLWYQAKVLELIAQVCFLPEAEFFCTRQKRAARERVEKTKSALAATLDQPLSLDALAREVGCSTCYLSRIFSQEAGLTIAQYLRQIRIEKAADLLLTGRYNVTEVALEVGYSSLSHFSRTFCETTGHCPALYATLKSARK